MVNGLKAGDRDIAMVFQFYALYPHLSAYDNIAFPLRAQKMEKADVDERVHSAASTLKIEYLLEEAAQQAGGGRAAARGAWAGRWCAARKST